MKNLIITTVLALGVAAPAVAQSQLERSLNVEAGVYSISELARLKAASTEQGNDGVVNLGNRKINFSASDIHNDRAAEIFANLAAESLENE